jgi:ADP-heptose:LPS heptosyltransferase
VDPLCTNALPQPPEVDRILVLRLGALGDVARTLPAASALRGGHPGAHLAWLVEPAARGALSGQLWIDEVLVFPRDELRAALRGVRLVRFTRALARFVRELRRRRFDLVIDFHSILKSGLLARASGAPRRAAYARPHGREGAWLLANARVRLREPRISRYSRNLALVRFLGVRAPARNVPLRVDPDARRRMLEALGSDPVPLLIHPGSSRTTPHKRWSAAGYAAVARELAEPGAPARVAFGPGSDERAFAESIVAASGESARLAPPTPTFADLAALCERSRVLIGSDSGPLHIASLLGTPVVQILGPTDPIENAPYTGTPSRTLRVPVACSPCRRGCAAAPCMRLVEPAAVAAAARELLATRECGW